MGSAMYGYNLLLFGVPRTDILAFIYNVQIIIL